MPPGSGNVSVPIFYAVKTAAQDYATAGFRRRIRIKVNAGRAAEVATQQDRQPDPAEGLYPPDDFPDVPVSDEDGSRYVTIDRT